VGNQFDHHWVTARSLPCEVECVAYPAWARTFLLKNPNDLAQDFVMNHRVAGTEFQRNLCKATLVPDEVEEESKSESEDDTEEQSEEDVVEVKPPAKGRSRAPGTKARRSSGRGNAALNPTSSPKPQRGSPAPDTHLAQVHQQVGDFADNLKLRRENEELVREAKAEKVRKEIEGASKAAYKAKKAKMMATMDRNAKEAAVEVKEGGRGRGRGRGRG